MWVYKFVELNPFGNIIDVLPDDLWYAKLIALYSAKCDEMFYNKVKSKSLNKKRWTIYLFIVKSLCIDGLLAWSNGCMFYLYQ